MSKEKLWAVLRDALTCKAPGGALGTLVTGHRGAVAPTLRGSKLQLRAHALAFRLLEGYIAAKSPDSATAYRVIVESLLDSYAQEEVRRTAAARSPTARPRPQAPRRVHHAA